MLLTEQGLHELPLKGPMGNRQYVGTVVCFSFYLVIFIFICGVPLLEFHVMVVPVLFICPSVIIQIHGGLTIMISNIYSVTQYKED